MKMNKFTSALITLALTISMGTTVFAAEITTQNGSADANINATYSAITPDPGTVYSVDMTWGSLEFAYNTNDTKTWDADQHKFVVTSGTPAWTCAEGADKITMTNHSNVDITANLAYAETNASGITGSFDKSKISLAAPAEGSTLDTAPTGAAKLTLNGALSELANKVDIGTVTVTVDKYVGVRVKNMDFCSNGFATPGEFYTTATEKVYIAEATAQAQQDPTKDYPAKQAWIRTTETTWTGVYYYFASNVAADGTYNLSTTASDNVKFRYYGTAVDRRYKLTFDLRDASNPTMTIKLL